MTDNKELYGKSPLMTILPDLKVFNALPAKERAAILREFVEKEMLLRQVEIWLFSE
jgi:hypothetical protein